MMSPDERDKMNAMGGDLDHMTRVISGIERRLFLAHLFSYTSLIGVIALTAYLIFSKTGAT